MKDIDLVIFDIKYKDKYLDWHEVLDFCCGQLPTVPILYIGKYTSQKVEDNTIGSSKLAYAIDKTKDHIKEGCVVKPVIEEDNNFRLGRKILKSINAEYLVGKNRTEHH